ncbi:DNA-binding response regulator [Paenibacillus chitinolyticus]|uniref:DNA-binding response regulator n=1 Tax=Paenibacillus chitinolyticus TaxID=79263 RepID=A0A410WSL9_9BACL|nr:response regulator transcription factor [Paenibacillus chitinolyticus]MCY9588859.1 response regulator transcription factor [Paenibacillus chitinolyticus]MCY9595637.1 response regulator transcription factor [Paenibacillus chitinolyticus]QAV17398.1 DNA-binding response regulator [Paenibacillus chitinolyticus]
MYGGTILLVDDETEITNLLEIYLKNEGYRLLKASDGAEALELLNENEVDLIILDVMMPRMDGIEACMKIREEKHMPIIMLSAKSQEIDKITGLSIGADDYVIKPFSPLEMLARVKSQLRRYRQLNSHSAKNENEILIEDLLINLGTHKVYVEGSEVRLTPREFAILQVLARNRGQVLSMEQIYEAVWDEPFFESNNTVMVHIRKIREKIEKDPSRPQMIKTVWGIGYTIE